MLDLIVNNGELILPTGKTKGDLGIKDGRIVSIGDLKGIQSEKSIQADQCLVFPGFIDPHVHFHDFDPGLRLSAPDEVFPLTRAAAFGGNTTLMDFAFPGKDEYLLDGLIQRRKMADGKVAVDYLLHLAVYSDDLASLNAISNARKLGLKSIKLILMRPPMTEDSVLSNIMRVAAENHVLVMVHAEEGTILQNSLTSLVQNGKTTIADFPLAHPRLAEIVSVKRCIKIASETNATVYICHISSREAKKIIFMAQQNALPVIGETTPQYLLMTDLYTMNRMEHYLFVRRRFVNLPTKKICGKA